MLSTRIQTLSRLQWYGQENELFQNQLAVDGYVYGIRGGIGLQVNHNWYKRGGINVSNFALTYSPKISISRTISLEPSLRFKMGNKALTASKMQGVNAVEIDRGIARDYYTNEAGPIGKQLWYKDLGAGLMVNTEWFFAGVQVDNMLRHRDNIYQQDYNNPRRAGNHFIASFGTDWVSRSKKLGLSPYVVYQNNEKLSEAWLGANFRWEWFTVGASISSKIEPAASLGMKFKHFALTYNADYTKSDMTGRSGLSHQVSIRFVSKPSKMGRRLLNL
jgi:type IX secretion system PorP/SprF family membrane protein